MGSRLRTVLIDDDPDIRALLALVLERDGRFQIVGEASDGQAGIEVVDRERPGAVVLDLEMRGLNGRAAAPVIRQRRPDTVIAVFTAVAGDVPPIPGADVTIDKTGPGALDRLVHNLLSRAAAPMWPLWERRAVARYST